MIRLLEAAAAASPDQVAVVTPEASSTYATLLDGARRVAAQLDQRTITRFAIVEPDAGTVITLLAGAALVGVEPCQYQPDTDPSEFALHAAALGHTVVVSRRDDLGPTLEVLSPDDLIAGPPSDRTVDDDAVQPLMIRTTGTTGLPKAAQHDWRVLTRTVASVHPAPDQRWLLAYGPQQFAGVQVLLHVLAAQATLIAPFPRQPVDGLEAMVNANVTCVSATPTYWRFVLAQARSRKLTLPPLAQITLGGEASPGDLLDDLRATFPETRISQVYASTEFGSVTSVKDGKPGLALESLFSENNPTSNIRVTDGELWIRAGAGMLGYVGHDSEDGPAEFGDDWRPSGDLVEVIDDRVHFVGRRSEVINVGGVKVHPLPVEERITALDSVALARVYGRPNKLTGSIVAAEIVPTARLADADTEAIRAEIDDAVADLPRAWRPRSLSFVEAIETKGGKTVRGMEA